MKKLILIIGCILGTTIHINAEINWNIYIQIENANDPLDDSIIENKNNPSKYITLSHPVPILTQWNGQTAKNLNEEIVNASEEINLTLKETLGLLLPLSSGQNPYFFKILLFAIPNCEDISSDNKPAQCALGIKPLDELLVSGQVLGIDTGNCKNSNEGLIHYPIKLKSLVSDFEENRIQMLYLSLNNSFLYLADKNSENENIQRPEYYWENFGTRNDNLYTHPEFKFESVSYIGADPPPTIKETEINNVQITLVDFTNKNEPEPISYQSYVNSAPSELYRKNMALNWMYVLDTEFSLVSSINIDLYPKPIIETSYKMSSVSSETPDILTFLNGETFSDASDLPSEAIFQFENLYPINTTGVTLIYPNGSTEKEFLPNNSTSGTIDNFKLNTLAIMPGKYTLKIEHIIPFGGTLSSSLDYNNNDEFDICSYKDEESSVSVTFEIGNNTNGAINIQ